MSARGFTLIEMSIVLVIIGMVVGGILTGRELVKSAEVRKVVSQIQSYDKASAAFRLKYDYLPGDIKLAKANAYGLAVCNRPAECGTNYRNGNGLMDDYSGGSYSSMIGESYLLFLDLEIAKLMPDTPITPTPGGNIYGGCHQTPCLKNDAGGFALVPYGEKNYWFLGYPNTSGAGHGITSNTGNILTAVFARALDLKMDDGRPLGGVVVSASVNSSAGFWQIMPGTVATMCTTTALPATAEYTNTEVTPQTGGASNSGCKLLILGSS